jgi:hypothetical protein
MRDGYDFVEEGKDMPEKKSSEYCTKCGELYYFSEEIAIEENWQCKKCRPFRLSAKRKLIISVGLIALIGCVRCFFIYPIDKIFIGVFIAYIGIFLLWLFSMVKPVHKIGHWKDKLTGRYIRAATTEELHPEWAKYQQNIREQIRADGLLKYILELIVTWLLFGFILSLLIGAFFGWKSMIL